MPSEDVPIGVGIIGFSGMVDYVRERISLRRDLKAISTCETGESPRHQADDDAVTAIDVVNDPRIGLVYFAGDTTAKLVADAIQNSKHIILESPAELRPADLRDLAGFAEANRVIATIHQPRHWSEDFLYAFDAVERGACGRVERIRLAIHERGMPDEVFSRGVLREVGYHYLDQLLMLVNGEPGTVLLRRFVDVGKAVEHGFLAVIDFADETSAVVELQTQSSLSLRTGWLVEGDQGAYRAGRYYSKTADGEIIDEPSPPLINSADLFFDLFSSASQGNAAAALRLPKLTHAARVTDLIDKLEQSVR